MPRKKSSVAEQLLDAHVHYMVEQLTGDGLQALIESELDALLADAAKLRLRDVVSAKTIRQTARTYAVEIESVLNAHELHARTAAKDVVSHERYTEAVDKLLELKSLREKLLRAAATSPIYIAFASELLYHGIRGYLARGTEATRGIPGAGSMMKLGRSVLSKASPGLETTLDESLKRYVARSVEVTARASAELVLKHLSDEALRSMARQIWDHVKVEPIGRLREDVGSDDVEDLFVIGYEYWRELRKTELYRTLIDAGIDAFFIAYGDVPLTALLDDLGITREIMLAEAMRYAPHVLRVLKRRKLLDGIVRRQLEGFYRSGAVERIVGTTAG
jgi:hypothetical protein